MMVGRRLFDEDSVARPEEIIKVIKSTISRWEINSYLADRMRNTNSMNGNRDEI
jgi:hypothetical protein